MNFDDLMYEKNKAVIVHQAARTPETARRAAELEDQVAAMLVENGDQERSVVNLISAGSLFVDAGLYEEGLDRLLRARKLTSSDALRVEIDQLLRSP